MSDRCFRYLPLSVVAVLVVAGCDGVWPQNDLVEGTVKLDGTPVPNVVVEFVPVPRDSQTQGPSSTAVTDDAGHYKLTCANKRSGAIVGKHNVVVLAGRSEGDGPARPVLPAVYAATEKTPLQIEVTAGEHNYDLPLSRNPPPRK